MKTGYPYIALTVAGIAAAAWGFPASHKLRSPFDIFAAIVVLVGILAAAIGILLTVIPDFFRL